MCGIAGFNFKLDKNDILKKLFHRGPDEQNELKIDDFHFFHTRLSIQDISKGHQPFRYKNYLIIFNGEIYNHLALRDELEEFKFSTNSDTETLLYLYIKYQTDMFKKIDGMFSFVIYDINKKTLFLARDRAGKKPLYIYQKGEKFAFSSEINVFKFLNLTVDEDDIKLFLSTGFCESGYKEIKEFPAGCYAFYNGKLILEKYFDIFDIYNQPKISNLEEALNLVENCLEKSVKNRLFSSDVEVGAFLSGGIDSSLIVAKASEFTKLKTFTVRFKGQFDESNLAGLVAKKYNTNHTIIDIEMDVRNNIEKIILNYGKPFFDSSAIPSFFVSKEARKHLKVILNGDGADEIFAGYRRYVPIANKWDRLAKKFKFILPFLTPESRGKVMFIYRLIRASSKTGIEWYNTLLNDLFVDIYRFESEKIEKIDKFIKEIKLDNFEKLLYADFELNLKEDLLVKMDIATMSNSIEGRSPFLSKYFLELAPKLDKTFKINKTYTKFILRELAKKYLPNELITAPKRGFEIPLTNWVNNELNEIIMDYLNHGFYKNFIDERVIKNIIEKKMKIPEDRRAKILYLLFTLEVWRKSENSIS
jgi:asparagine synthase (glutamine-hydrolysing)